MLKSKSPSLQKYLPCISWCSEESFVFSSAWGVRYIQRFIFLWLVPLPLEKNQNPLVSSYPPECEILVEPQILCITRAPKVLSCFSQVLGPGGPLPSGWVIHCQPAVRLNLCIKGIFAFVSPPPICCPFCVSSFAQSQNCCHHFPASPSSPVVNNPTSSSLVQSFELQELEPRTRSSVHRPGPSAFTWCRTNPPVNRVHCPSLTLFSTRRRQWAF